MKSCIFSLWAFYQIGNDYWTSSGSDFRKLLTNSGPPYSYIGSTSHDINLGPPLIKMLSQTCRSSSNVKLSFNKLGMILSSSIKCSMTNFLKSIASCLNSLIHFCLPVYESLISDYYVSYLCMDCILCSNSQWSLSISGGIISLSTRVMIHGN